jgi:hypothetical protein
MALIYALENTITGYAYIGCTSGNMAKRLREHRCVLRKGEHRVGLLQSDWFKYGESAFKIKCIEAFDSQENVVFKRARELYWMQDYSLRNKLYNEHQVSFCGTPSSLKKAVAKAAITPKTQSYYNVRDEVLERTLLTKENKEGNRQRQLKRWQDPAYREKMLIALAKGRNKVK